MLTHSGASLSKHAMVRATYRDAPYGPYERSLRVVILYPFHKIKLYIWATLIQPTIWEKSLYDGVELEKSLDDAVHRRRTL